MRPHFPLLRRERQSYNNGTLIAAVRFLIFDHFYVLFVTIYPLYLSHHIPFDHQVCDLPSEELAANDKSRRAIALHHQLIPRYMASWKVIYPVISWKVLYHSYMASWKVTIFLVTWPPHLTNYVYWCKVDRALGAASAKVELMRELKLGMETTMPSALLEV